MGRLTFKGISEETVVRSPHGGSVDVRNIPATDKSEAYKIVVLKSINNQGQEVDIAMTIPGSSQLTHELEDGSEVVRAGQKLFTLNQDTVLSPSTGNNMEINAFIGSPGDQSSFKQVDIDLATDPISNRIPVIGQ